MSNWIRNVAMGAVLAGSILVAQSAAAAVSMVAKIGTIKGESVASNHVGEIDVLSFSWGVSNPDAKNGSQSATKGTPLVLTLTKYVDSASPLLFQNAAEGTVLPQAQFVVMKVGGKAPVEMIKIKLQNVVVASVTTGQPLANDRVAETITLVFSGAEYSYTGQNADQTAAAAVTVRWGSFSAPAVRKLPARPRG